MTYVFGLNIPLLELLLVFLVLSSLGLILIYIELRKLRQLIGEEKKDLREFEANLVRLEEDEDSLGRLAKYIQEAQARGIPKQEIEEILKGRGWETQKIDQYLK
jgi:hypothetical protein